MRRSIGLAFARTASAKSTAATATDGRVTSFMCPDRLSSSRGSVEHLTIADALAFASSGWRAQRRSLVWGWSLRIGIVRASRHKREGHDWSRALLVHVMLIGRVEDAPRIALALPSRMRPRRIRRPGFRFPGTVGVDGAAGAAGSPDASLSGKGALAVDRTPWVGKRGWWPERTERQRRRGGPGERARADANGNPPVDAAPDSGCADRESLRAQGGARSPLQIRWNRHDRERSVGTAHGTVVNTQLSGNGSVTLTGATGSQYVGLPSGIVSQLTNATLEVWVTWNGGGGWQRIFDFGDSVGHGNEGFDDPRFDAQGWVQPQLHGTGGAPHRLQASGSDDGPGTERDGGERHDDRNGRARLRSSSTTATI